MTLRSDAERSPAVEGGLSGGPFRVAGWEVKPRALTLRRDGQEQRIEPRVMALLVDLAEHAGEVVTRDELLERVWSDVTVSDDAVHSAVSKLRRALGPEDGRRAIETVPKAGYRLVAKVVRVPSRAELNGDVTREGFDRASSSWVLAHPSNPRQQSRGRWLAWPVVVLVAGVAIFRWSRVEEEAVGIPRSQPDVRPVTSWTGLEVGPALVPGDQGDRVAFAWKGPDQANWDIWVQVLGAGDPLRLTTDPAVDHHPAWSPDGTRLAFFRYRGEGCEIMQVPALGGAERHLADCADGEDLTWAPGGNHLLWAERRTPKEPFRIVEFEIGTRRRRMVTTPPSGAVGDLGPVVSPDGTTLAFQRSPVLGVQDIFLKPRAGGPVRRLTSDDLKIHGMDWMPDGRYLIFSSNRAGLFSLWQVAATGGEPTWLGVSGGDLDAPSVGASGRRVAFEQWNDDTNVYRLPVVGGAAAERVLGSTRWDWRPHVSADGARAVFVSDRTGAAELWSARLFRPGSARQLTEMNGPYLDRPRFSPDGGKIAFDGRPRGNADVYVLEVDSRAVRRLTDHAAEDVAPSWSRDGRALYFASNRGGSWQVWRVPAGGGQPVRVTEAGGFFAEESVDGRWLYFSRRHEPGIWRRPVQSVGAAEQMTADLVPLDRSHFVVTDEALLFIRRPHPDRPVLSRLDLETGQVDDVGELGRIPYNSGLALDRDGRSVVFTRIDRWESDILVLDRGR